MQGSYEYCIEHAVSIECEGFPGWLNKYQILQNHWAIESQSKFRLIKIHYEKHVPGKGKSVTHTEHLMTNVFEDVDVHKNVP